MEHISILTFVGHKSLAVLQITWLPVGKIIFRMHPNIKNKQQISVNLLEERLSELPMSSKENDIKKPLSSGGDIKR